MEAFGNNGVAEPRLGRVCRVRFPFFRLFRVEVHPIGLACGRRDDGSRAVVFLVAWRGVPASVFRLLRRRRHVFARRGNSVYSKSLGRIFFDPRAPCRVFRVFSRNVAGQSLLTRYGFGN